jgi:hypothetical protein
MSNADLMADTPDSNEHEKDLETVPRTTGSWRDGPAGPADANLLEELREPIAAASNYLGAARLLIAAHDMEYCRAAVEQLAHAEQQLLRAGGIIGRMYTGSKGTNGSRVS